MRERQEPDELEPDELEAVLPLPVVAPPEVLEEVPPLLELVEVPLELEDEEVAAAVIVTPPGWGPASTRTPPPP